MRPILSGVELANEIRYLEIANGDILVSYHVSSLSTNVPLDETIVSRKQSFHKQLVKYNVRLELHQNGSCWPSPCRYQITNVSVQWSPVRTDSCSPHGPLLAYVLCPASPGEENLERKGKAPSFYRSYVDDMLTIVPNIVIASTFLDTLNKAHSSVKFTTETECNGMPPHMSTKLLNRSPQMEKKVYVHIRVMLTIDTKKAWSSILFIFVLVTFLEWMWSFEDGILTLKYPKHPVNCTIKSSIESKGCDQQQLLSRPTGTDDMVRGILPFQDHISGDTEGKQFKDPSLKVHTTIQPVFAGPKQSHQL